MRNVEFTSEAMSQLQEWIKSNPRKAGKIIELANESLLNPFDGKGRPEALKHNFKGKWSKRIDEEHRMVYEVLPDKIIVISCKYHYE